tara:strand:- start:33 stop:290 length:258 start_codon:yes stop_codon:yes gene_type:complete
MSRYIVEQHPYCPEEWTVFELGRYERSSVLAGQEKKIMIEQYDSKEEALAAYPSAEETSGYQPRNTFGHLPGNDDFDGQGGVWGL